MKGCAALVALAWLAASAGAAAAQDAIAGAWRQVESDAGPCPACRLTIARDEAGWVLTANNGWSARIEGRFTPVEGLGAGAGRWAPGRPHAVAGRRFTARIALQGGRLHLRMSVEVGEGVRVVRAVYERAEWLGV